MTGHVSKLAGQATVAARVGKVTRRHIIYVAKDNNCPVLFGRDWISAFFGRNRVKRLTKNTIATVSKNKPAKLAEIFEKYKNTVSTRVGRVESDNGSFIKSYFTSLSPAQRSLLSEICTVYKLILVMPATNAVSERSFSGLRRVKDYCRSTMSQCRLNNLMVLIMAKLLTNLIWRQ